MISRFHSNNSWQNWLAYRTFEQGIVRYSSYYKGVIIDLGCGEKPYQHYIEQFSSNYIGVDWANTFHQLAMDAVVDLNKELPFKDNSADTLFSLSVIEHLCEPQTFLNESYRILKPDCALILQVPWQWRVHEAPYDFFRYTPYGLAYMLEKAGFTDIDIQPQGGFFTSWVLKFNYFTNRIVKGPKYFRVLVKLCLLPFWTMGQCLAPLLDKLDDDWSEEAAGYFVFARKARVS